MENANNASQKEIERKYRIGISEEAKQGKNLRFQPRSQESEKQEKFFDKESPYMSAMYGSQGEPYEAREARIQEKAKQRRA